MSKDNDLLKRSYMLGLFIFRLKDSATLSFININVYF